MNDVDELTPADERAESIKAEWSRYESKRNIVIWIALVCAVLFGVINVVVMTLATTRYPNVDPTIMIVGALAQGGFNALLVWGAPVLWTVFFAPRTWILFSPRGQSWRERSGLSRNNVAGLRIMALLTGTIVTVIAVVQIRMFVDHVMGRIKEGSF